MPVYLADTSIWSWANRGRRPDIARTLSGRLDRNEVATCHPVVVEYLHEARTAAALERLLENTFAPVHWLVSGRRTWARALAVQRSLARAGDGRHRRPAMDFVIAATAELAGDVILWAFDRDMQVICEHTGQPCELESAAAD